MVPSLRGCCRRMNSRQQKPHRQTGAGGKGLGSTDSFYCVFSADHPCHLGSGVHGAEPGGCHSLSGSRSSLSALGKAVFSRDTRGTDIPAGGANSMGTWASLPRPRSCLLMALRQLFSLPISQRARMLWLGLLQVFFTQKLCSSGRMELPSSQLLPAGALPPMSPLCHAPCLLRSTHQTLPAISAPPIGAYQDHAPLAGPG